MIKKSDNIECRQHEGHRGQSEHGRSTVVITCPFCDCDVEAYCWSLAGSGKRCPECGAIHGGWGMTYNKKTANTIELEKQRPPNAARN